MEQRPTFEGRSDVGRLLVFVVLAVFVAAVLHWWVGLDRLPSVLLAMAFLLVLWLIELVITTGLLHKLEEQKTERLRIDAAMLDAAAVNSAQDEVLEELWSQIQALGKRLDAMETIRIRDRDKVTVIDKTDALDLQLADWITSVVFDSRGAMPGVHARNGQLKYAMPFKDKAGEEGRGYRRLLAAGLVVKQGDNYMWTGPQVLSLALDKLRAVKGIN